MPVIIGSPEGWFREQGKDLHVFDYCAEWLDSNALDNEEAQENQYRQDVRCLEGWVSTHYSDLSIMFFGPSEYSGWIEGGPSSPAAAMDESTATAIQSALSDSGLPWRIETLSYAHWLASLQSCRLLLLPLSESQSLLWWDTPAGIVLLSADSQGKLLSREDAWWRLCQLIPELTDFTLDSFPRGRFYPKGQAGEHQMIVVSPGDVYGKLWRAEDYIRNAARIALLREALGIKPDEEAILVTDDF